MEVISCVVGIRMAIPTTLPSAGRVEFPIMNLEIVVRIPADGESCVIHYCRIVTRFEFDAEFEMVACVRDGGFSDLVCRTEPGL